MKRGKRSKAQGRYESGETFAIVPSEVMRSEAYLGLPDWAKSVLWALAERYRGSNNGDLALTWPSARSSGVSNEKKLRAGLRLIERTGLIVMTRPGGNVAGGEKKPTLFAVGWRKIDESPKYAVLNGALLNAPNDWARWTRPEDWDAQIKAEWWRAKGDKNPHSTRGAQSAPHAGRDTDAYRTTRGAQQGRSTAPRGGATSRDLGGEREIERTVRDLIVSQSHLSDFDIAVATRWKFDVTRIRAIRQSLPLDDEPTEDAA